MVVARVSAFFPVTCGRAGMKVLWLASPFSSAIICINAAWVFKCIKRRHLVACRCCKREIEVVMKSQFQFAYLLNCIYHVGFTFSINSIFSLSSICINCLCNKNSVRFDYYDSIRTKKLAMSLLCSITLLSLNCADVFQWSASMRKNMTRGERKTHKLREQWITMNY